MQVDIVILGMNFNIDVPEDEAPFLRCAADKVNMIYKDKDEQQNGLSAKDCQGIAALLSSFELIKELEVKKSEVLQLEDDLLMIKMSSSPSYSGVRS